MGGSDSGGVVDIERARPVEPTECGDAIPDTCEQDGKFGPRHDLFLMLKLCRAEERNSDVRWRVCLRRQIEFHRCEAGGGYQIGLTSARADALRREGRKGPDKIRQYFGIARKDMKVEMKILAGREDPAIEMSGAKHEGARPVRQSAGGQFPRCDSLPRLKDLRVGTSAADFTNLSAGTRWHAGDAAKDGTQRAA